MVGEKMKDSKIKKNFTELSQIQPLDIVEWIVFFTVGILLSFSYIFSAAKLSDKRRDKIQTQLEPLETQKMCSN